MHINPYMNQSDSDKVKKFISNIIVNEFNFKLEFDTLDAAFGLQKPLLMMIIPIPINKNKKY
jgi:hypothetical protein